jgi:geranylgeranylglycerol-phosphate geranylgeranyltransferase
MAAGNAPAALVPAAIAFAFVLCREIVKGGEDLEGDMACGVRTIAVTAGRPLAGRTAAVLMLALAVLIPIPVLTLHYRVGYFVLMEGVVVPALLFGATRVADATDRSVFGRTSRALKLAMFVGIVAIAAGA